MGTHASGRNSGVLHAGFYYTADSLKARFTRQGNQELTHYCLEKELRINQCGKLVVARNEDDLSGLDELFSRGKVNGVPLEMIDETQAKEIEPRAITHQKALWSPSTSSVDPGQVLQTMTEDALAEGVEIATETAFVRFEKGSIQTTKDNYQAGYLINAAGLYADQIAKHFGFSEHYRVLPFKGLYLYSNEPTGSFRTNIYPVPNLGNPFLGVHFTLTAGGESKIGPTAIPAFWREQYSGLENFSLSELLDILRRQAGLFFLSGFDFKRLAWEEIQKYYRPHLVKLATELARGITPQHYKRWGKPGMRAQLLDTRTRKLEMDFVFEYDDKSLHVLNAVSPGFTCALPFARHICDQLP